MAIDALTAGDIIFEVAGLIEDRQEQGTLTTGGTTTHDDANNLAIYSNTDDKLLLGHHFIVYKGLSAGSSQPISAFTPANDRITVPVAITLTDNTSQYLITKRFRLQDYLDTLQGAQRELRAWKPVPYVKEAVDRSIIIGSPFSNGTFYLWTNGTTSVPDGWTLTVGSASQNTTLVKGGRYALNINNANSAAADVNQSLLNIGRYKGLIVTARCWAYATTGARHTLELTDGVTTETVTHGGTGFEALETPVFVIADAATSLKLSFKTSTGTSLNWRISVARAIAYPQFPHEYPIESGPTYWTFEKGMQAGGSIGAADGALVDTAETKVPTGSAKILYESTRKLQLPGLDNALNDRILTIRGWAYHAKLSAVTTTWTGDPEPLIWTMAARLALRKNREMAAEFEAKAREFRANFQVPVKLPLLYIEPN